MKAYSTLLILIASLAVFQIFSLFLLWNGSNVISPKVQKMPQHDDKFAYVTYLSSLEYFPGVIALGRSLKRTSFQKRVVMIRAEAPGFSVEITDFLENEGWEVQIILSIANPDKSRKGSYNEWNFTKLRMWTLNYGVVIYLDADTLVLQNLDYLFHVPFREGEVLAVGECGYTQLQSDCISHSEFNSGVLVLHPSAKTFKLMVEAMPNLPSATGGDQGFLNLFFQGSWRPLSFQYNFLKMHPEDAVRKFDTFLRDNLDSIFVVHYLGRKPWIIHAKGGSFFASLQCKDSYRTEEFCEVNYTDERYLKYEQPRLFSLWHALNRVLDFRNFNPVDLAQRSISKLKDVCADQMCRKTNSGLSPEIESIIYGDKNFAQMFSRHHLQELLLY